MPPFTPQGQITFSLSLSLSLSLLPPFALPSLFPFLSSFFPFHLSSFPCTSCIVAVFKLWTTVGHVDRCSVICLLFVTDPMNSLTVGGSPRFPAILASFPLLYSPIPRLDLIVYLALTWLWSGFASGCSRPALCLPLNEGSMMLIRYRVHEVHGVHGVTCSTYPHRPSCIDASSYPNLP